MEFFWTLSLLMKLFVRKVPFFIFLHLSFFIYLSSFIFLHLSFFSTKKKTISSFIFHLSFILSLHLSFILSLHLSFIYLSSFIFLHLSFFIYLSFQLKKKAKQNK